MGEIVDFPSNQNPKSISIFNEGEHVCLEAGDFYIMMTPEQAEQVAEGLIDKARILTG